MTEAISEYTRKREGGDGDGKVERRREITLKLDTIE